MSDSLTLDSDEKFQLIRPISWIILIGYVILAILTFILIQYIEFARELFEDTEVIIKINAVWFSMGIVGYGIYAIQKNRRRAKLSNLNISLDTQFLIVVAFFLFGLKQIIDLILYYSTSTDINFINAMKNAGKVLEFGGFMAGLASIYYGRKRN